METVGKTRQRWQSTRKTSPARDTPNGGRITARAVQLIVKRRAKDAGLRWCFPLVSYQVMVVGSFGMTVNTQDLEILNYVIVLVAVFMVNVKVFSFIT